MTSSVIGAYGAFALGANTQMSLTGGSITTTGESAIGAYVQGGKLALSNVAVHTESLTALLFAGNSYGAYGINTAAGGQLTANGGSVVTDGAFGIGVRSSGVNAKTTATDLTVLTRGSSGYGVQARDSSITEVTRVGVQTLGSLGYGMYAWRAGASITGTDTTVATQGADAYGAYALANGNITLNRGSIATQGARASGLVASGPGAVVNATDVSVQTSGRTAIGVYAMDSGQATMLRGNISTTNSSAPGAVADGVGSLVALTDLSVTTTGAGGHGTKVSNGATLTGSGVTVNANAADASTLFITGAAGTTGNASFTGSNLTSSSAPSIAIAGGGARVDLSDTHVTGDQLWLRVATANAFVASAREGLLIGAQPLSSDPLGELSATPGVETLQAGTNPGSATITATNSTITGAALTETGSTANLTLVNSLWNLTGNSNLTSLINDPSLINFTAPAGGVFKTLTVNSYSGDGRIALNTVLGADASPSDKLIINGGGATGSSSLLIKNAAGRGALTTGNGILVVDTLNGGTTAADAFRLGGRVVAGPYEYTLQRASVDGSNDQAWFLRSTAEPTPPAPPTPPGPPGPTPPTPTPPTPPTPPEPPRPNYRPETSLYSAVPAMALVYSRALIDTLHERVGEERRLSTDPLPTEDQQNYGPSLGWGRLIYRSGEKDQGGSASGSSPGYNYDLNAFQVGLDLYHAANSSGATDQAGLSLSAGTLRGGVTHTTRLNAGDDTLRTVGLGGYWTHFGPAGWYVDGVLQFNHFDVESRPNEIGKLTTHGWGYTASLEGGYPFEVKKDLFVEPQAQLIYTTVDLDSSSDIGADVRFEDVNSLIGRLGVRIAKDWFREDKGKWLRTNAWVRPSVWREFKGQPKTEFSSESGFVPFESDIGGTFGEVNLGLDVEADKRTTFYVSAGYQQAFDGNSHGYEGMLGFKVKF
ncbi:autotransporter outer membrane beta-barrel domain-containing protein [Pseudomonas sp. NA-150]|uniref:autotransporter family protein n=1 Tax=Pseudomonas sp. NA-150 TaxID=3367525 RepID=UPI0037CC9A6C